MSTTISNNVVIPALLEEMARKISDSSLAEDEQHKKYLEYVAGWIQGAAENEYKELLTRDGIPEDPRIVKLLCELAVMRAVVRWHEIRDRPPPMPSIANL